MHTQRLRHALREYFPAALDAFEDLDAPESLELLAKAADQASAAKLSRSQSTAALKGARRRDIDGRAARIQAALRAPQLGQPPVVTAAYAASARALTAVLAVADAQVCALQSEVEVHFGQHPAAKIIGSQPGVGPIIIARVLAEFGDDPRRYADVRARRNDKHCARGVGYNAALSTHHQTAQRADRAERGCHTASGPAGRSAGAPQPTATAKTCIAVWLIRAAPTFGSVRYLMVLPGSSGTVSV